MPAKKKTVGDDGVSSTNPTSSNNTDDQNLNFSLNIGDSTDQSITQQPNEFDGKISDFSDMMMDQEIAPELPQDIDINLDEDVLPETTEQTNTEISEEILTPETLQSETDIPTMNFDLTEISEPADTTAQPTIENLSTNVENDTTESTPIFMTTEPQMTEENVVNDSAPIFDMPTETQVAAQPSVTAETKIQQPTSFTPIIETPKAQEIATAQPDMTFDLGSISDKPKTASPVLIPIEELEKKVDATESNIVKEELSNINTNNITSRPRHATAAPVSKGFFFIVAFLILAAGGYFVYDFMYSSQGAQTDIIGSTKTPDTSVSTGDESVSDTGEENTTMDSEDSTGSEETMTGDTASENSTGDILVDESSDNTLTGDVSTGSTSDENITTSSEDSITTDSESSNTKSPVKESTSDDENQIKIDENSSSDTESITTSGDEEKPDTKTVTNKDNSTDISTFKELSKKAEDIYKKATSTENTLAAKFAKAAKDKADTTIKSLQNGDNVDIAKAKEYVEKFISGAQRKISTQ